MMLNPVISRLYGSAAKPKNEKVKTGFQFSPSSFHLFGKMDLNARSVIKSKPFRVLKSPSDGLFEALLESLRVFKAHLLELCSVETISQVVSGPATVKIDHLIIERLIQNLGNELRH